MNKHQLEQQKLEAENLYQQYKAEQETLQQRKKQLEEELVGIEERLKELYNPWRGYGLVDKTKQKVEDLKVQIDVMRCPHLVYLEDLPYNKKYRITRVTNKRIYYTYRGRFENYISREKENTSLWERVDIEATVQAWKDSGSYRFKIK